MFASFDPVALDMACVDAANKQVVIRDSYLGEKEQHTSDHFINNHPETNWEVCIDPVSYTHLVDKLNVVGLSISVIENNKISYSQGFGYADIDKSIKTDTNTIYRIASISKSITASAIMKLYEEGKFKLDDDINDYLNGFEVRNPNFPDEKITFRMLLTHTSSTVSYTHLDVYKRQAYP